MKFSERMFRLIADNDLFGDMWWRYDDLDSPQFFVQCNDIFYWGCSDCEEVTPENLPVLEQSIADCEHWANILFCARVRKMRPQGAAYDLLDKKYWPLLDACGPERETGHGNPMKPGQYVKWRNKQDGLLRFLFRWVRRVATSDAR